MIFVNFTQNPTFWTLFFMYLFLLIHPHINADKPVSTFYYICYLLFSHSDILYWDMFCCIIYNVTMWQGNTQEISIHSIVEIKGFANVCRLYRTVECFIIINNKTGRYDKVIYYLLIGLNQVYSRNTLLSVQLTSEIGFFQFYHMSNCFGLTHA